MAFTNGQDVVANDLNNFSVTTVTTTGNIASGGKITAASTAADALDVEGGITVGSGNVALVNTAGKIAGLSSTYLADLSGVNLTGIPVLLKANSGSTTNASAENVDTLALSGLTAKDTIAIELTLEAVTQQTASVILQNSTDSVTIVDVWDAGLGAMVAGRELISTLKIRQAQSAATLVAGMGRGHADNNVAHNTGNFATFTTNWTGSWTLALRHGGVTAGGTFRWSWAVYKIQGQ